MSKLYNLDVKLIYYLKEATRSKFLTENRLYVLTRAKKEQKIGPKRVKNTKLPFKKPNGISKCPKCIEAYSNWFST